MASKSNLEEILISKDLISKDSNIFKNIATTKEDSTNEDSTNEDSINEDSTNKNIINENLTNEDSTIKDFKNLVINTERYFTNIFKGKYNERNLSFKTTNNYFFAIIRLVPIDENDENDKNKDKLLFRFNKDMTDDLMEKITIFMSELINLSNNIKKNRHQYYLLQYENENKTELSDFNILVLTANYDKDKYINKINNRRFKFTRINIPKSTLIWKDSDFITNNKKSYDPFNSNFLLNNDSNQGLRNTKEKKLSKNLQDLSYILNKLNLDDLFQIKELDKSSLGRIRLMYDHIIKQN